MSCAFLANFLLAADGDAPGGSMWISMLPFLAIGLLFYFLLIKPQKGEQARRRLMLSNVKVNDHVLTTAGIYGVVANIHRKTDEVIITLKVDDATNTKLRMTLGSIAQVLGDGTEEDNSSK